MSFKIVLKEKEFEKKIFLKGNIFNFDWNKLRENILEKSKMFKEKRVKDADNFVLELTEVPNNFNFPLTSIWNTKTFNYFVEKLKTFQENNPNDEIKLRFSLMKVAKLPKWEMTKYDTYLKNVLENTWKNEEEIITSKLNNFELTNRQNEFLKKNNREKEMNETINKNIICNSCLSVDFFGPRYICSYCNNFNLCRKCFNLGNHNPEHNFIICKGPVLDDDIIKYNSRFSPCTEVLRNIYDSFEVTFKIANIGEKDLNKCYMTYINFNGNYLWCEKFIINENLERNNSTEIKLKINFKDKKENKNGIFEGYFRMFNQNGVPFGDILKIRVKNDKI